MGYFIGKSEKMMGYYEGDRQHPDDEEVSRRDDAVALQDAKKSVEERLAAIEKKVGL